MTEAKFKRDNINVVTNSRVVKVNPTSVVYKDKSTGKQEEVPFGVCLWSTGVGMTPLVKSLVLKLPEGSQQNKHAIETDRYMRVIGTPEGTVYAIGDCATIRTSLQSLFSFIHLDYCPFFPQCLQQVKQTH